MKPKSPSTPDEPAQDVEQVGKPKPRGATKAAAQGAKKRPQTPPDDPHPAASVDPIDEASWESFPASDPPGY